MTESFEVRLRDGARVTARPLAPGDRGAVAEVYRALSPEGRYHRFWTHTGEEIGEKMLDRILAVDPANHGVWGIIDPSREIIGVGGASWWRCAHHPEEAEIAVTVLDRDQGRGVGTLLLAIMWLSAFDAGIRRLVAYAHADNRRAAGWMNRCGACGEWDGYKLVFRWDLDDLDRLPATRPAAELAAWLAELAPRLLNRPIP